MTERPGDALHSVILDEFGFLTARGFVTTVATPTSITFQSADGVFVEVTRGDWRDGYVDYVVGLTAHPEEAFSRGDLRDLMWAGVIVRMDVARRDYRDELHASVARAAEELRQHEPRLLSGELLRDDTARRFVDELRSARTRLYMRPDDD